MYLSKLGTFAQLALAANTILLPPAITTDRLGDDYALETLAISPSKRSVAIECPGCPLAVAEGDKLSWTPGVGNAFSLEFEVGPLESSLMIDGLQLYPPSFGYFLKSFHITQVDLQSGNNRRLRVTGYKFRYNGAETVSEAGMELLPMTLQLTSVEGMPIDPPTLTINVLKDTEGRLMIASFQTQQAAQKTEDEKKHCDQWPLLCHWRNIVSGKMDKLKKLGGGCHRQPHGLSAMEDGTAKQAKYQPHHVRPHHHRPHHAGHSHHHRHYRVHMFLRRALFTVLVPVLIGIFAGTLTYLIGMALGCLIAIVIAKFRGQRYERVGNEDDMAEGGSGGEKEGYAELPAYDAPTQYEREAEKKADESQ